MGNLFISKRDWTYNGKSLNVGEVFEATGSLRDAQLLGDNTHWSTRLIEGVGFEPIECTTDGCGRKFATLGQRDRHARMVHAIEREDRVRLAKERREMLEAREARGETIGGYDVVKYEDTGKGKVPYVKI